MQLDAVEPRGIERKHAQVVQPRPGGQEELGLAAGWFKQPVVRCPDGPPHDVLRNLRWREKGAARFAELWCVVDRQRNRH